MADRLTARTGREFAQIGDPAHFTPDRLADLHAGRVFVPHWSRIIPSTIFDRFETIVFHMTDLPYGRGGSPLQNLIVRGHTETKISALRCEAGLDTGPIYSKRPLSLAGTAEEIFERAAAIIEDMIVEIVMNELAPQPQTGAVTEFRRRKPADGDLAPLGALSNVYDYIRMLDADGYPPAFIDCGRWRIEFSQAALGDDAVEAAARIVLREPGAKGTP